ncbi:unnamed protein product, partial [Allacma fusca]
GSKSPNADDNFIQELFSIFGLDLFMNSLNFQLDQEELETIFDLEFHLINFTNLLDKLVKTWKIPGNLKKCVESTDFIDGFMNLSKLFLEELLQFHKSSVELENREDQGLAFFRLSFVVIWIFHVNRVIRENHQRGLEKLFQEIMDSTLIGCLPHTLKLFCKNELSEFEQILVRYDNKPDWVTKLWTIINFPNLQKN